MLCSFGIYCFSPADSYLPMLPIPADAFLPGRARLPQMFRVWFDCRRSVIIAPWTFRFALGVWRKQSTPARSVQRRRAQSRHHRDERVDLSMPTRPRPCVTMSTPGSSPPSPLRASCISHFFLSGCNTQSGSQGGSGQRGGGGTSIRGGETTNRRRQDGCAASEEKRE